MEVIAENNMTAYNFNFNSIDGDKLELSKYKGKVIIIVNVASKCGFTKQYTDMQSLWDMYKDKGVVIMKHDYKNII